MSTSDTVFDVIVIGAGHNGLVCAGYLAAAGLKVKVLERRHVVGGAAVTEEFHPGFRNSVASYALGLLNPKVISDLDLTGNGLQIVERRLGNFWPLGPDRYLKLPFDLPGRQAEVVRFSKADAAALPAYTASLETTVGLLGRLVLETPPNAGGGLGDVVKAVRLGNRLRGLTLEGQQTLLDLFAKSAADYLAQWFESDEVRAALAFDSIIGFYGSPHTPGSAYVLLHHAFGEVKGKRGVWGHAIGGMGAVSQAMAKAAERRGVSISLNAEVSEVIVEAGHTVGVALADGTVVRGRSVASNLNPKLLFEKLVDPELLAPEFRRRMAHWKCASGTFRMNVALSELPDFTCLPGTDLQDHHTSGIVIGPSLDYLDRAYLDARQFGWSRKPVIEMLIPSTIDPTLAPEGRHVASLFCQHFAPELPDGASWDSHRETAADLIIDTVNDHAPNFKASVLGRQILSPLDLERSFGLVGGDIFHGAQTLDQMFWARPMLGHADYRAPVKGLYMCGSGTHPGGGVTGAPGHNAAREIIRDFRRRKL